MMKDPEKKKAYMRLYYAKNKRKLIAQIVACQRANPEQDKIRRKRYQIRNKERILHRNKLYRINNREKLNTYQRKWRFGKRNDANFLISRSLRARLSSALKRNKKPERTLKLMGCSLDDLRSHLDGLFNSGMTWENYGRVWCIDHIRPLASFDLTDANQILEACNFNNLQPLLNEDNLKKGARLNWTPI